MSRFKISMPAEHLFDAAALRAKLHIVAGDLQELRVLLAEMRRQRDGWRRVALERTALRDEEREEGRGAKGGRPCIGDSSNDINRAKSATPSGDQKSKPKP